MDNTKREPAALGIAIGTMTAAIFGVDLALPLGVAGGVPYMAPVLSSMWLRRNRHVVLVAAVASVLTLAGMVLSPAGGEMWKVVLNRGLAVAAIGVAAALVLQRKRDERALLESSARSEQRVEERTAELSESNRRLSREIGDRKRVLEALSVENTFRRAIEDSARAGIVAVDRDSRVIYANRSFCELVGVAEEEIMGDAAPYRWWPPDQVEHIQSRLRDTLAGRAPTAGVETWFQSVDGRRVEVLVQSSPLTADNGKATGWLASVYDISELKRVQREGRLWQERLSAIVAMAPNAIISVNEAGRITMFNGGAERVFGYSSEEALGQPLDIVLPEPVRSRHAGHLAAFADGEVSSRMMDGRGEVYGLRKDGTRFPAEASISKLEIDSERVFTVIMSDITARKAAEQALRESNERLESAIGELRRTQEQVIRQERLQAIGTMASGIAHDYNNSLTPILGYCDLLLSDSGLVQGSPRAGEYLQLMRTAAEDAAEVVRRLRNFYRRRDQAQVFGPVNVATLVQEVIDLTRPKWKDQAQAEGGAIEVLVDVDPGLAVDGNAFEIRDMVTNLVLNAIDAMPEGGAIGIRGRRAPGRTGIEVSDTGAGMTDEVRLHCMEPFLSTKGERGTGLGLAIVHGIIQRHKGSIDIQSEPGKGTRFSIWLPSWESAEEPESGTQQEGGLADLRVLVVDDEPAALGVVTAMLADDGHSVVTAESGRQALDKFRPDRFDLVFTDRAMPDINGDKVAAQIKRVSPETPVVMLTGFGDLMESAQERPTGVDVVVAKPFTRADIRRAMTDLSPA